MKKYSGDETLPDLNSELEISRDPRVARSLEGFYSSIRLDRLFTTSTGVERIRVNFVISYVAGHLHNVRYVRNKTSLASALRSIGRGTILSIGRDIDRYR